MSLEFNLPSALIKAVATVDGDISLNLPDGRIRLTSREDNVTIAIDPKQETNVKLEDVSTRAKHLLLVAQRQFRYNNSNEFVMGYDGNTTNKIVLELLRSIDNCEEENRKLRAKVALQEAENLAKSPAK